MKFTPLPQPLPKECAKAARIFQSFVDTRNTGFDKVIPRSVLQHANGFAIFSVFKAGFVFSARGGSGVVIARLADGSWSAPSAIGTAGMGFGSQAGAEVTDFLIILNSISAVRSFMSAGSLTLGGNMSIAVGPLGRNGEASGSLGSRGNVATMYSYSKTKGLFGGVSVEGSVIMERQDANALAYQSDVTARKLLSGAISPPEWSRELIMTLENCTGITGGRTWIHDGTAEQGYAFGGLASSSSKTSRQKKARSVASFPPASWGRSKDSGSYFAPVPGNDTISQKSRRTGSPMRPVIETDPYDFPTQFESDSSVMKYPSPSSGRVSPFPKENEELDTALSPHRRPLSQSLQPFHSSNPFSQTQSRIRTNPFTPSVSSIVSATPEGALTAPLRSYEGIARAIALFDFKAIEPGDLAFSKGDVIVVTEKSESTNDWWTGNLNGRRGIFPANFVELT